MPLSGHRVEASAEGLLTDSGNCLVTNLRHSHSDGIEYWTNQGWYTGALPGALTVPRIYFQYYQDPATRVVVSSADVQKLEQRMYELGSNVLNSSNNVWCAVANWNFPGIVGAYLYNYRIQDVASAPFPPPDPDYHCPGPFSYNGHSYVGGNYYDARTILRDYLEHMMDDWLQNGTEEDFSPSGYYSFQIHSIALLYDFAPDASPG